MDYSGIKTAVFMQYSTRVKRSHELLQLDTAVFTKYMYTLKKKREKRGGEA